MQTEAVCDSGHDPEKHMLIGRQMKNRKRLSAMLPPEEADHLRLVGTLTGTINCTQAALGSTVKFRWATPSNTDSFMQMYNHDPPAPTFRWDCIPGW